MPVVADPFLGVIFDPDVLVLFGVDKNIFVAFIVLETDFIKALAAFARIRFERGDSGLARQAVGRHGFSIVNTPGDDGTIGVTLKKFDDDLLDDSRNIKGPPFFARRGA